MKGLSSILLVAAIGVTGLGSLALGQEPSAIPRGPINQARAVARRQAVQARIARHFPGVRFSERTSGITRVYGQAFGFGDTPQQAAEDFLVSYSEMFGVARDQLAPRGVQEVMGGKFKAMYYEQTYNGVPVHHGRVTLLTRSDLGNAVVLAAPHLYDLSGAEPAAVRLTAGQVLAEMQRRYPVFTFTEPELVVYLDTVGEEARPMYAYRFIGGNTAKELPEKYEFMVDASSDEALIVNLRSMILFEDLEGTVTGMGTSGELPDRADNLPVEKPLEDMWVRIVEGNAGYTASNGDYAIADAGADPVTAEASVAGLGATEAGRWVRVIDTAGDELALDQEVTPPGPADFLFNPSPAEFLTAQVNGFIFTTEVHNFVKSIDPSYPLSFEEMPCYVNRSGGYCPGNAWYDYSSINFCRAASGYPNTAYSSVIFHEYGHHVVDSGHPTATGDYHEGLADVTANLLMETSCLGRGFSGGSSCLRNAYNSVSYPCSGDAHYCGQVLSGAFWLTRDELVLTEPDDYLEIIRSLYLNSILLQPAAVSPDITIDVLTLDDDDGDLDNGTPHWEEICSGFGAKNLDCPELLALDFYYPNGRPQPAAPGQPTVFEIKVTALGETPLSGTGQLHYSLDGAAYETVPMNEILVNEYEATLPTADCGSSYAWYVSVETAEAGTITDPLDAPAASYATVIATSTTTTLDHDFEADQGWTVGDVDDDATTGIWERADPEGTAAQPEDDHTPDPGTTCWVTDGRAGSTPGAYDVDGGKTTLLSPTADLSVFDHATVSYYRWYCNDAAGNPNADIFVVDISNNDGGTWTNAETIGPAGPGTSGGWLYHEFLVADFVPLTDQIKVRFIASDVDYGSVIEAAVDDFRLSGFNCTEPSCTCGDVNNSGGPVDLEDFATFALCFGLPGPGPDCADQEWHCADLDGDEEITLNDFSTFALWYGLTSTQTPPHCQ